MVFIDDLDILKTYIGGKFIDTRMQGWMCKVSAMVHAPITEVIQEDNQIKQSGNSESVIHGYQILSLYFENNWGGTLKTIGAIQTQRIPSATARFANSLGNSGETIDSVLKTGLKLSVNVSIDDANIFSVSGIIGDNLNSVDENFANFIIMRPHKFLLQTSGEVAYSREFGSGAEFSSRGCAHISITELQLEGLLANIGLNNYMVDNLLDPNIV